MSKLTDVLITGGRSQAWAQRVGRLIFEREMTYRAACIVVDAAMFSIGCVEGAVREAQQKRIDKGEQL
jgi:hypothetical protein